MTNFSFSIDLLAHDIILIPLNWDNQHLTLGVSVTGDFQTVY